MLLLVLGGILYAGLGRPAPLPARAITPYQVTLVHEAWPISAFAEARAFYWPDPADVRKVAVPSPLPVGEIVTVLTEPADFLVQIRARDVWTGWIPVGYLAKETK